MEGSEVESAAGTGTANGVSSPTTAAPQGAAYPIRTRTPIDPNASAPMPFQTARAGRIVDVVLPPNVVIVAAALGRTRFSREEMKCTLAEFLEQHPYEAKAGSYLVFTAMNLGPKPIEVKGEVLVVGEHGDVAPPVAQKTESADDVATEAARRKAENDAVMEALIDSAEPAAGAAPRRKVARNAREKERDRQKEKRRAATSAQAARAASAPASTSTPTTPAKKAPLPKAIRSQRVVTRRDRKAKLAAERERAHEQTPSVQAAASAGHRVSVLHHSYAEMLDLLFEAGVPLREDARTGIAGALHDAAPAESGAPINVMVDEVALRLTASDHEALVNALDARAEFAIEDATRIAAAVRAALATPTSGAVYGVGAERPSEAVVSSQAPQVPEASQASQVPEASQASRVPEVTSPSAPSAPPAAPAATQSSAEPIVAPPPAARIATNAANVVSIGSRHASDDGRPG